MKRKLLGVGASKDLERAAEKFARAQLQIFWIRKIQAEALAELAKAPEGDHAKTIRRLGALDRYERYAFTAQERALRFLELPERSQLI